MKVTGNESHHDLTLRIWFTHEFPYIYWMNSNYVILVSIGWYRCHLRKHINTYIFYFQLKAWLYVVYEWFLMHLYSLWIFWWLNPTTYYHIAFYICIFVIKIWILENIMWYTLSQVHFSSRWQLQWYNTQSSSIFSFIFQFTPLYLNKLQRIIINIDITSQL